MTTTLSYSVRHMAGFFIYASPQRDHASLRTVRLHIRRSADKVSVDGTSTLPPKRFRSSTAPFCRMLHSPVRLRVDSKSLGILRRGGRQGLCRGTPRIKSFTLR